MHSLSAFYIEGGEKMQFKEAFEAMKKGKKVKYPNWGGYWYWDHIKGTVMMHTFDGQEVDLFDSQRKEYTLGFLAGDEFEIVEE